MGRYRTTPAHLRGYDKKWEKVRNAFIAEHPLCKMCGDKGILTPADVVDHIVTIREDPSRRLDRTNLQSLCALCHNSTKAREDAAGYSGKADADGWPVDPRHPANRVRQRG